jgi:hypothetical protein
MSINARWIAVGAVACVGLVSSTAWAAATVTSAMIRDESILSRDIRNGTVASVDIRNGTVSSADIRDGSIAMTDLATATRDALMLTATQLREQLATVDGAGSGVDADTLDGIQASGFQAAGSSAGGDLAGTYPNPTLKAQPYVELQLAANQTVASATVTAVSWTQEVEDVSSMFSPTTPTIVTIPKSGIYAFQFGGRWDGSVGGNPATVFETYLDRNSGQFLGVNVMSGTPVNNYPQLSGVSRLTAGDVLEVRVRQDFGAPGDLTDGDDTFLRVAWIGP